MATSDIDLSIRVAVIRILGDIESHFPLEEEEKEKLCFLLFDEEPRVRRAVSSFVKTVWEEEVDEKLGSLHKPSEKDKERIGIKVLAELLVKWGKALDNISGDMGESEVGDEGPETGEGVNGRRQSKRRKELIALVTTEDRGRISMAVEALWDEVISVSDWQDLLELLLLDHSASEGESQVGPSRGRPRVNGKSHKDDFDVDESWRLEEAEETALLEVLVAAIRMAKEGSTGGKKVCNSIQGFQGSFMSLQGEEENVSNDITRALIKGLPRLFIKHQSDPNRIAELLVLPTLMNLDLYLEMRMITVCPFFLRLSSRLTFIYCVGLL
jgi:cohesin complex subunit SA-1/2